MAETVTHPKHRHKLKQVVVEENNEELVCNICFESCSEGNNNILWCEECKFSIHVPCGRGIHDRKLSHGSHKHDGDLVLQQRPASFHCDACGKEDPREPSYLCTVCQLWIHQSCASLPSVFRNHPDHDHNLSLEFSLPHEFRPFKLSCDVCALPLHSPYWLYYCSPCRFFVHIKCAGKKRLVAEDDIEAYPKLNLALLPDPNPTMTLLLRFLQQNGILELENFMPLEIEHHLHRLALLSHDKVSQPICDGCTGSIDDRSYYSCQQCTYFMHIACSQLPDDLELYHPSHPDHPLYITYLDTCCSLRECSHCRLHTNGWLFQCRNGSCDFLLDMKCAFLPRAIAHKSHRHPLSRISVSDVDCTACGNRLYAGLAYGCEACGFYLGNDCALLPPTATHRWDSHPLSLIFPPFTDHPDEFICEVCEEAAHPKYWLYHCKVCDQSFHPNCIPGLDHHSRNIKFGSAIQIAKHSLKLIERGKYKSQCGVCEKRLDMGNALQCTECDLHMCRECILKTMTLEDVNTISPCNGDSP